MSPRRAPLLIASFHRSGSSLTAHMLHSAGLHLGNQLLGAKPSNPHGHFEDKEVIALHDQALASQGHAWYQDRGAVAMQQPFLLAQIKAYAMEKWAQYQTFGVKDPRLCLTVRHWHAALTRVNVIFVHRDADLSRTSLWSRALRDYQAGHAKNLNAALVKDPDLIGRIYGHNIASFLSWHRSLGPSPDNVIFVAYDDIVSGARNLVQECQARWGYDLNNVDIDDFFDENAVTATGQGIVALRDQILAARLSEMNDTLNELSAT